MTMESSHVPLKLVGESIKPNDVAVDMVCVTHLQLGELPFNEADVVWVPEMCAEGVPEGACGYLKLLIRFLEFLEPPVDGGTFQVGAGIESLLLRGIVTLLIAQEDHAALTFEEVKFLWFRTIETVRALDLNLLGVYAGEGISEGALDKLHVADVHITQSVGRTMRGCCCSEDGTNPLTSRLREELGGDGFS